MAGREGGLCERDFARLSSDIWHCYTHVTEAAREKQPVQDERWKIWAAIIAFFVFIRLVRGVFRAMSGAKGGAKTGDGMARLNAAAERILKERSASGQKSGTANPLPRSSGATAAQPKPRVQVYNAKPGAKSGPIQTRSNPAVMRRGGLLSGQEPVIQRRR
jgi:hypothetical protein